tara:strand:- start:4078 stop:4368 length:291 start_codon:yes stop_codon:yes gene_type:complete
LAIVKSKLVKELSDNYPNFIKKDIIRLIDIILDDMKISLAKKERVELRDIFTLETKVQKERISRNPKTNEKIKTPEKKYVRFKMSKEWMKKVNEKS